VSVTTASWTCRAAVLGIAHADDATKRAVLDLVVAQTGKPPFNPRAAVAKFVGILRQYGLSHVTGDAYAGQTFQSDFAEHGISYAIAGSAKSDIYDRFEPLLNAGAVELLDVPELTEQLLTLVVRGSKIDHQPGDHDDYANAAAGAIDHATNRGDCQGWVGHYQRMAANRGKIEQPSSEAKPESVAHALALTAAPAPPHRATVTLHAPGPWASFYIRKSSYCSDSSGLIHGVAPEHVEGLCDAGCRPVTGSRESGSI
jgi:hypothetical protein